MLLDELFVAFVSDFRVCSWLHSSCHETAHQTNQRERLVSRYTCNIFRVWAMSYFHWKNNRGTICKQDAGTECISPEEKIRGCSLSQSEWVMHYLFAGEQIHCTCTVGLWLWWWFSFLPLLSCDLSHKPEKTADSKLMTWTLVFPWNDIWGIGKEIPFWWHVITQMPQGKFVSTNQKHQWDLGSDTSSVFRPCSSLTTASLSGGRCPGCPGASTLAKPAPTQTYAPVAGKPAPSSHEPPCQCNQAPVRLIYQWKKIKGGGRDVG